jgi:hypothetical protein
VATLLKLYFRELPSPLVPPSCLRKLLSTRGLPVEQYIEVARDTVTREFPALNAKCLRLLVAFLYRLNLCCESNKMTAKNLGVCFAPSLLRPSDSEELALTDIQPAIAMIERLIENAPEIFLDNLWDEYPAGDA